MFGAERMGFLVFAVLGTPCFGEKNTCLTIGGGVSYPPFWCDRLYININIYIYIFIYTHIHIYIIYPIAMFWSIEACSTNKVRWICGDPSQLKEPNETWPFLSRFSVSLAKPMTPSWWFLSVSPRFFPRPQWPVEEFSAKEWTFLQHQRELRPSKTSSPWWVSTKRSCSNSFISWIQCLEAEDMGGSMAMGV